MGKDEGGWVDDGKGMVNDVEVVQSLGGGGGDVKFYEGRDFYLCVGGGVDGSGGSIGVDDSGGSIGVDDSGGSVVYKSGGGRQFRNG